MSLVSSTNTVLTGSQLSAGCEQPSITSWWGGGGQHIYTPLSSCLAQTSGLRHQWIRKMTGWPMHLMAIFGSGSSSSPVQGEARGGDPVLRSAQLCVLWPQSSNKTEVLRTSCWFPCQTAAVTQSRFSPSLSSSLHFPISVGFALCCHGYCYFVHSFYLPSIDPPFRYVFFLSTLCVVLCGVCVHRVSCVFLCTSWRSEGSLRWPGLWMRCWTWPPPDTPSPRRQPLPGPLATSRQRSCHRTCSVRLVWKWC